MSEIERRGGREVEGLLMMTQTTLLRIIRRRLRWRRRVGSRGEVGEAIPVDRFRLVPWTTRGWFRVRLRWNWRLLGSLVVIIGGGRMRGELRFIVMVEISLR